MSTPSYCGIVLLVDNANFGRAQSYELPIWGKSMKQWVSLSLGDASVNYINYDDGIDLVKQVGGLAGEAEYTVVLYSDTPLIQKRTVLEAVSYAASRGLEICRMTRGFVFLSSYLKTLGELSSTKRYYFSDEDDFVTAHDFKQLSFISDIMRTRILSFHMSKGVHIIDPAATYIDGDVIIGDDVTIHPGNTLRGATKINSGVTLMQGNTITDSIIDSGATLTNSNLNTCFIGSETTVGPYAYIRPETVVGKHCRIGDFVELKKSKIGDGSKVSHLAYIGDCIMGEHCNIGCGVITANYDGKKKSPTVIGNHVFVGSNSNLIAPVTLQDNCFIAAGSTITDDVDGNALAIARARQVVKTNWVR